MLWSGAMHAGLMLDDRLEEKPSTRHRDYILTDYDPVCDPAGKLHCATALRHGLRAAGLLDATWPVIEALRAHLGADQTVWGLKYTPRGVSTELYFYNNRNNPPGHPMSTTRLAEVLRPYVRAEPVPDESRGYFMCSIELDAPSLARGESEGFRVYFGSGDKVRTPCGLSYRVRAARYELENHYAFYYADRPDEMRDLRARIAAAPRAGSVHEAALLPESMFPCRTVCYAVKPRHDGLYFSRVTTAQLRSFLKEHSPGPLLDLLDAHADGFSHLRWDVGYDFELGARISGPLRFDKIGVYGVA